MQVVFLIDGAHHLLLTVVDGGYGQVAEGLLLGYAPDGVAALLLELPVAEGTDDIVILQAFRLMDGEDADTVGLVALYGLAAETVIPLCEEGVDVGSVLADIFGELVIEGEDIGTLVVALFETEDGM